MAAARLRRLLRDRAARRARPRRRCDQRGDLAARVQPRLRRTGPPGRRAGRRRCGHRARGHHRRGRHEWHRGDRRGRPDRVDGDRRPGDDRVTRRAGRARAGGGRATGRGRLGRSAARRARRRALHDLRRHPADPRRHGPGLGPWPGGHGRCLRDRRRRGPRRVPRGPARAAGQRPRDRPRDRRQHRQPGTCRHRLRGAGRRAAAARAARVPPRLDRRPGPAPRTGHRRPDRDPTPRPAVQQRRAGRARAPRRPRGAGHRAVARARERPGGPRTPAGARPHEARLRRDGQPRDAHAADGDHRTERDAAGARRRADRRPARHAGDPAAVERGDDGPHRDRPARRLRDRPWDHRGAAGRRRPHPPPA